MNPKTKPENRDLPMLVSMGEPGGIGPELILKIWSERKTNHTPPFVFVGRSDFMQARARLLGLAVPCAPWPQVADQAASNTSLPALFDRALPVLEINETVSDRPGIADPANGRAVIAAIDRAVDALWARTASALITCPINKKSLYDAGFAHPGHTEYLADRAMAWPGGPFTPVMMLAGPDLRTVPATLHIPLREVPSRLTAAGLLECIVITERELKTRFAIAAPRIVVTGLNPHAGEEGSMGHEDAAIIRPAIEAARRRGLDVSGPHPADTLFYREKRATYDAAIAMYHDQALLPVKTLAFDETVNVTLGLPFIRTSPDHGTALDIAGKGIARPDSLLAALQMADAMVQHAQNTMASR
ncbi:MAG: 4-hydroxythreonine-4-phosphate dehydrogenase PdxA [Rhizobiales bacterium]|nr:4-hydroxythreonine-4-phosphate dehydrogenase PdxA [Hyphomicrobiales bacterium]